MKTLQSLQITKRWILFPIVLLVGSYILFMNYEDETSKLFYLDPFSGNNSKLFQKHSTLLKKLHQFEEEGGRFRVPILRDCSNLESINGFCTFSKPLSQILSSISQLEVLNNNTLFIKHILHPQDDFKELKDTSITSGYFHFYENTDKIIQAAENYLKKFIDNVFVFNEENIIPTQRNNILELLFQNDPLKVSNDFFPNNLDLLTVDIDSFDCQFLEQILKFVSPKVIIAEFNPIFPPGIVFMKQYSEKTKIVYENPYHGCSVSALNYITEKYNYKFLQLHLFQAFFVKKEYISLFKPLTIEASFAIGPYTSEIMESLKSRGTDFPHYNLWSETLDTYNSLRHVMNIEEMLNTINKSLSTTLEKDDYILDSVDNLQITLPFGKRFCYMSQGPEKPASRFKELISSDSDFIWLTWKTENEETDVYFPNSTWSEGRNRLYQEAKNRELQQGWQYLYYIFFDGDVIVDLIEANKTSRNAWRMWERFLLSYQPAISTIEFDHDPEATSARFGNNQEMSIFFHFDALVSAFHREAAEVILPYETSWDPISWYYSQVITFYKTYAIFRNYDLIYHFGRASAYEHHSYPKQFDWDNLVLNFSSKAVPKEIRECMIPFNIAAQKNIWGTPKKKDIFYNTRTIYTAKHCGNWRDNK